MTPIHLPNMPDDTGITTGPGYTRCTGVGVDIFRIHALRGMMRLELLGMRRRGRSAFASVKQEFGLRGRNHSVYAQFCHMHNMEE